MAGEAKSGQNHAKTIELYWKMAKSLPKTRRNYIILNEQADKLTQPIFGFILALIIGYSFQPYIHYLGFFSIYKKF